MAPFPRHPIAIAAWVIWFGACLAVLIFAYVQREVHDVGIAFAWLMIILTFPLGYLAAYAIGLVLWSVYSISGASGSAGFEYNAVSWVIFVATGHVQWFMLLPALVRRLQRGRPSNPPVNPDARDVPAHASDRAARAGYRAR